MTNKPSQPQPKINAPIPRAWAGGCAVLIGGGPSLTDEQCEYVQGYRQRGECYVLGINDAYRKTELDALYACDTVWWDHHHRAVKETLMCPLFTQDETSAAKYDLWHIPGPNRNRPEASNSGLSYDPARIHYGDNSGYQAINLVYHLGVKNIVLLGYDLKKKGAARHWFGEHPDGFSNVLNYDSFIAKFGPMSEQLQQLGVRVVNCSPDTAIPWFPQMHLSDALRWYWRPCFDRLEWPDEN